MFRVFPGSSMVERLPVKERVVGSNPTRGAKCLYQVSVACAKIASIIDFRIDARRKCNEKSSIYPVYSQGKKNTFLSAHLPIM